MKILYPLAMLLVTVACTSKKPMTADAENEQIVDVPFKVAQNYFYNNVGHPSTKLTDPSDFAKSFGMATVMGDKGKPTDIDFNKEFLIDVIFPVTTWEMEVNPIKVEAKGDTLYYSYNVSVGKKLSYSIRPISIVIIDKEYVRPEVVLVNDQNISIEQAVDRYLVEEIGRDYAKAAHCVPFYSIIDIDSEMDEETVLKLNILLNTHLNGLSIEEINLGMITALKQQAGIHGDLIGNVIDAVALAIHDEEDLEIYTSGANNILKYPELSDNHKAGELINTLEEKQVLGKLVQDTLADENNTGIQVYIGNESPITAMKDCSIVTATYDMGEGMKGTIGIIGPKRMDYDKVVDNLKQVMHQLDSMKFKM